MVDISFGVSLLEQARRGQAAVADIAEPALAPLLRLNVTAAIFGRVAAAATFAAALDSARTVAGRGLTTEADARRRQAQATGSALVAGTDMIAETQRAAASATPPGDR